MSEKYCRAPVWQTESEQATPMYSIKDIVRSSLKVPEFDKHLKSPKRYENNNKDEDNSPKTLNDKNIDNVSTYKRTVDVPLKSRHIDEV